MHQSMRCDSVEIAGINGTIRYCEAGFDVFITSLPPFR